jgi:hypothetical protein
MNRFSAFAISCSALLAWSGLAIAKEPVREFRGSHTTETLEFEVNAPWLLDWRLGTDYPGQMGVDITLIEAGTGAYQGNVLKTKWPGNGVRLFNESGKYQFKIVSHLANWTLKVEQLTPEEAEQYTPRVRSQ